MYTYWLSLAFIWGTLQADPVPTGGGTGVQIENFSLLDQKGRAHELSDWKNRKYLVVVFLGVDCPLAKLYAPRLAELAKTYQEQVGFLGIHTNANESPEDLARFARDHHIPFVLLRDVGHAIADRFGAKCTPEAFVLDEKRVIRYRGRIDDQYDVGFQRQGSTHQDLQEALDELLAGKEVSRPSTEAIGCLINRAKSPADGSVTYSQDIAPILRQHCQHCHRPGQIAPFSLGSYREASSWAAMIREVVQQGRMPPWGANPKHGRFANDPSLTATEKKLLLGWIGADCPEGDPAESVPAPPFTEGWTISKPDLVVSMAAPFTIPAQGVIEYQSFVVDPGFKEDAWIQAAEIRPGNRAVVHHCNVYLQAPDSSDLMEQGTLGSVVLAVMAAGTPPLILPQGMAKRIPAGWRLVFVMHYSAIGSQQTDQTSLGLKFADPKTVRKEVATKLMVDAELTIPPHEPNFQLSHTWQINQDVVLLSFFPHMHLRGRSFRYEAIDPNGQVEILLDIPHYDFNWQHVYVLSQPRKLTAGSRLRCTGVYDNSANNPANPDPSATVHAGPQSWDEMFNGYFDVVLADQDLTRPVPWTTKIGNAVRRFFSPGIGLVLILGISLFLTRRRFGKVSPPPSRDSV